MEKLEYTYLLAFGSNLDDRRACIEGGLEALAPYGAVLRMSRLLETEPLPSRDFEVEGHAPYLNAECLFLSPLLPAELYDRVRVIEDRFGHPRHRRWLPRQLDIDLIAAWSGNLLEEDPRPLFFEGADGFRVPHREFWNRDFLIQLAREDLAISESVLRAATTMPQPGSGATHAE